MGSQFARLVKRDKPIKTLIVSIAGAIEEADRSNAEIIIYKPSKDRNCLQVLRTVPFYFDGVAATDLCEGLDNNQDLFFFSEHKDCFKVHVLEEGATAVKSYDISGPCLDKERLNAQLVKDKSGQAYLAIPNHVMGPLARANTALQTQNVNQGETGPSLGLIDKPGLNKL